MNTPEVDNDFENLLHYLSQSRGSDFTAYKRPSLMRRVSKRMQTVNVPDYASYIEYLEVHPGEFQELFNTVLINVTGFFRDPPAWDYIRDEVVPSLIARKEPAEPIRVWSAGCASGQEAYSIAILLAEALGPEAFRQRVKVYATDRDEEALDQARRASFSDRDVQAVPPELRQRYFEPTGDLYVFDREMRRSVIFGRVDLLQDAPISHVDLILCRNVMMYFNTQAQDRILSRLHFALNEGGFLVLGKAETMLTHAGLFAPVNLKNRVFTQKTAMRLRDRLHHIKDGREGPEGDAETPAARFRDMAFELSPLPSIVVDADGHLVLANNRARTMFRIGPADLGRLLQDLEISYRPVEIRSLLEQVFEQRRTIQTKDVRWEPPGREPVYLTVDVIPILNGVLHGATVTFTDVTESQRLQRDLQHYTEELETAYEELQSTNEELQTTNEELQSTIEELETTNEELQSTNEEMETMNEELQSTNEEMEALNDELNERTKEITETNGFLNSILSSLPSGMVVMDRGLHILAWNDHAEELWGLRAQEVRGQHLMNLDFGLPLDQLRQPIRACLSDGADTREVETRAVNRRGRSIGCRITCLPLRRNDEEPFGVLLQMDEVGAPESEV